MKAEIIGIVDETFDVKTFILKPESVIEFVSGQYCLVFLGEESRPFTYVNSPTDENIQLTIKKMGEFTSKLHELKIGDELELKGPKGSALNFDSEIKEDVVFIAGGSGITPFISALRYASKKNLPNKITLVYSNRTKDDIIFREELELLNTLDNINIINTLSKEEIEEYENGRISKDMIQKYITNFKEKLWYVCAPPPMVAAMKEILLQLDIPKENLRIEDWQIAGKHDEVK